MMYRFKGWDVILNLTTYHDGRLALRMLGAKSDHNATRDVIEGEPVAMISINLDDEPNDNCIWVKDWSENEGMDEWLEEQGIGKHTGRNSIAGYCIASEFLISPSIIKEHGS